jgi:uncharacterized membrane protein YdjX (TVP38/TMEM64 family)
MEGVRSSRSLASVGLLVVLATVAGFAFGPTLLDVARDATSRLVAMGTSGHALFVAIFALATLAFLPAWILALAAGAAFPYAEACALCLAGSTLGSVLCFLTARHLVRAAVERRLAASPRLAALDEAFAAHGTLVVFLLRLSPIVPYNLLNYLLGATRVRLRDVLAGAVGMIPATLLFVGVGRTMADVGEAAVGERTRSAGEWALVAVGVVATLAVTFLLARTSSRALARISGERRA